MSAQVKPFPVSAEAMSRLTALAGDVTIAQLQRAELATLAIVDPPRTSTLIAMLYAPGITPLEREQILQLLEAKP